jgi:hypothetical protein
MIEPPGREQLGGMATVTGCPRSWPIAAIAAAKGGGSVSIPRWWMSTAELEVASVAKELAQENKKLRASNAELLKALADIYEIALNDDLGGLDAIADRASAAIYSAIAAAKEVRHGNPSRTT